MEIWTDGRKPYPKMNNRAVRAGLERDPNFMHPNVGCENALYDLMKDCWKQDADARPSFARILQRLEAIQGRQLQSPADTSLDIGGYAKPVGSADSTEEPDGYERPVVRTAETVAGAGVGAGAATMPESSIATTAFGVYGPSIVASKKSKHKTASRSGRKRNSRALEFTNAATTVISPLYNYSSKEALLDSQV